MNAKLQTTGLSGGDGHALAGHTDDPGDRLPEHQDQEADQSDFDRQAAVVEEPVELVQPFALAHDRSVVMLESGLIGADQVLFSCPAEEPGGVMAGAGTAGGPGVRVGLGDGLQLAAAAGQPVEEADRDGGGLEVVQVWQALLDVRVWRSRRWWRVAASVVVKRLNR